MAAPRDSRALTPVERKEAQLQQLEQAHQERVRKLAFQRQQILHSQALYLGRVEPNAAKPSSSDAQARATEREALLQRLMDEQAASETLLESLKQGSSLAAARRASQAVHAEMQAIRANAADTAHPTTAPYFASHSQLAHSSTLLHRTSPDEPGALSKPSGHTARASAHAKHALDGHTWTSGGTHGASRTVGPHTSLLWGPEPATTQTSRAQTGRHTGLTPSADTPTQGLGGEQWDSVGVGVGGVQGGRGVDSRAARGTHSAALHGHRTPGVRDPEGQGESPAYIQELKSQVETLRSLLETQLQRQVSAPQAPVIVPMPWYPGPGPPQQQQQQPAAQQDALPADVLAVDPAMRTLHAHHMRDMTLLRMEIDKARTATELEQIKATLSELRQRGQSQDMSQQQPYAPLPSLPPPGGTPGTAPPQPVIMMDVPTHTHDTLHAAVDPLAQDDDMESDFTEDDDTLDLKLANLGAGTVVRADVVNVHILSLGPCVVRGSYRVRVVLYDGFQPLFVAPGVVVGASTNRRTVTSVNAQQAVTFNETLCLRGLSLTATMMLVFEVYVAKQPLAGMPSREDLCAWSYVNALMYGEVVSGRQSVPVYRMPIMLSAQRHFSYHDAMLDFSVSHREGEHGDGVPQDVATGRGLSPGHPLSSPHTQAGGSTQEDIAGVPTSAFVKVARGTPPAEPFTPGAGFVVVVDGARFLPANVTISKVVGTVISPDGQPLTPPFEALSRPDSDAYQPRYGQQCVLAQGQDKFDNAAATLLLTVYTIERWSNALRVVGYAAVPCFLDVRTREQPLSKNVQDYVLNAGAFQVPLHTSVPSGGRVFRASSLEEGSCRVACASLLLRITTCESARALKRQPPPVYTDRVYDSVRAVPTPAERPLFVKYLARKPLLVREAARLLVSGQGGKAAQDADSSLPSSDEELLDWIETRLRPDNTASLTTPINYNLASEYYQDLGFYVSVDGAMRLPRNLPSGAIVTFAPPGSFYQDNPVVDDMKVTLEYDMSACLAAPRWLDGYQHFADIVYEPGLALLIDVRLLVPSAGTTSPVGWAVLPVFERTGAFVASGTYHLPLFQGVPSRNIIQEFANKGDVDAVVMQQLRCKRLNVHDECPSVLVRLLDASRQGQMQEPLRPDMGAARLDKLRVPTYVSELGASYLANMRRAVQNKTYAQTKPPNVSQGVWKESLNSCLCKIVGLDVTYKDFADQEDEDESVI